MSKEIKQLTFVFLAFMALGSVSLAAPSGSPAERDTNNTPQPLYTSGAQNKMGGLAVSGVVPPAGQELSFAGLVVYNSVAPVQLVAGSAVPPASPNLVVVQGAMGADKYCNSAGTNCKTVSELAVGGGSSDVPKGAIFLFNGSCPDGFDLYSEMNGRFPRSAATDAEIGATGGGQGHSHLVPFSPMGLTGGGYYHMIAAQSTGVTVDILAGKENSAYKYGSYPPFQKLYFCKKK